MVSIKFSNNECFVDFVFEIENVPFVSENNDTRLNLILQSGPYSASQQFWIHGNAMEQFIADLIQFEETRTGKVCLESMSPGELELTFERVSSAGRTSISGMLSNMRFEKTPSRNKLNFGFDFDPSQLIEAVVELKHLISSKLNSK